MKRQVFGMVLCMLGFAFLACNDGKEGTESSGSGSAIVSVKSALSIEDISRITVTVSGSAISPNIIQDLEGNPSEGWTGLIQNIPAGSNRLVLAEAFSATNELLYSGNATVAIVNNETAAVTIYLQQVTAPDPFANDAPQFSSIVASQTMVGYLQDVSIEVVATDADNDPLTYLWVSSCGTFSDNVAASTTWTSPNEESLCNLIITVSDPNGASITTDFTIDVSESFGAGSLAVNVDLNTWPLVLGVSTSQVDEVITIDLTSSDADGDTLTFVWSSTCSGSFSTTDTEDTIFTLVSTTGTCDIVCTVTDERGGINTATITVNNEVFAGITEEQDTEEPPVVHTPKPAFDASGMTCYSGLFDIASHTLSELENLTCINGNLRIVSSATSQLTLPNLVYVSGNIDIQSNANLSLVSMPNLQEVGGYLFGLYNTNVLTIAADNLYRIGTSLAVGYNTSCVSVEFPLLEQVEAVDIVDNASLATVDLSSLWEVRDHFSIQDNPLLDACSLVDASIVQGTYVVQNNLTASCQ